MKISLEHVILKSLGVLVGGYAGFNFGWLIYAILSAEYSQLSTWVNLYAYSSLYLFTLIGLVIAFNADLNYMKLKSFLYTIVWLTIISIWTSIIGLAIFLGGLNNISPAFIPLVGLLLIIVYTLSLIFVVGKKRFRSKKIQYVFVNISSLVLLTLIPTIFELIYPRTNTELSKNLSHKIMNSEKEILNYNQRDKNSKYI